MPEPIVRDGRAPAQILRPGIAGPPGPTGAAGAAGAPGASGTPGADGASAYQVAVANGFVGSQADWLASLVGPEGDPGPAGAAGAPGAAGSDGATGPVQFLFSIGTDLAVTAGDGSEDLPIVNGTGAALNILTVAAALGQAPTGAAVILDVLIDGSSIYTTAGHRPTIADGQQVAADEVDVPLWAAGELLVVRVVQVGSSTPGARLAGYVLAEPS
jgi:hypothetical protein